VTRKSSWPSICQGFWKKQAYEKIPSHVKGKEEIKHKFIQAWKQSSQLDWELWNLAGVMKNVCPQTFARGGGKYGQWDITYPLLSI
jgi:hypothetical protein